MRDARIEELPPILTGDSTHRVRSLNNGDELPVIRTGLFVHAQLLDLNPRQEAGR